MTDEEALDIYRAHLAKERAAGRAKTYAPDAMPHGRQKVISVRVDEAAWIRAFAVASSRGRTITDVVNEALMACGGDQGGESKRASA